ncbi:MAG: hypothetical protein WCH75_01915, partial [Candidatus Binatia bacterium]
GRTVLSIVDFAASIFNLRGGAARLDIRTSFTDTNQAVAILGALGGAAVEVVIDTDSSGMSLPRGVESVSGVTPDPF